jgi:diaminopropionate ammonia-lyase
MHFSLPYSFMLFPPIASRLARGNGQWSSTFLSTEDIQRARWEISSWPDYRPTPLHRLSGLAKATGVSAIFYKDEGYRFGLGSFKALGGAYAVLRLLQSYVAAEIGKCPSSADLRTEKYRDITGRFIVTTATDGNHGRGVAWGAQVFGCRSIVYVPKQCSKTRQTVIESFGAYVERTACGYDETLQLCIADAERHGRVMVSDVSWQDYIATPSLIMQGYSVMTGEILEQLADDNVPTHVFVQGGVGALAAAVCAHFSQAWIKARPTIIIVEPEGAACLYASALAGKPTPAMGKINTIMAGLCCREPSPLAWSTLEHCADFFLTVPDDVVSDCMKFLAIPPYGDRPIVAGETAIAGLAGFLCVNRDAGARQTLGLTPQSCVLLLGTEGDTDRVIYEQIVECPSDEVRKRAMAFGT